MSPLKSKTIGLPLALQHDLFGANNALPEGFAYQPELITSSEETELVRHLEGLPFQAFDFHGHVANRPVVGYGLRYHYDRREVVEAPPIPDFLQPPRENAVRHSRCRAACPGGRSPL
jgi:hypothetical protein